MVEFDLEVVGLESTLSALQRLKEAWTDPPVFAIGTDQDYAVHLEFGRGPVEADTAEALRFRNDAGEVIYRTRVSGHPPYPFVKPAAREFQAGPRRFVRKNTGRSIDDARSVDQLLNWMASALETQIKKNATAQRSTGRSPGTHPDHPQVQSGALRISIKAVRIA